MSVLDSYEISESIINIIIKKKSFSTEKWDNHCFSSAFTLNLIQNLFRVRAYNMTNLLKVNYKNSFETLLRNTGGKSKMSYLPKRRNEHCNYRKLLFTSWSSCIFWRMLQQCNMNSSLFRLTCYLNLCVSKREKLLLWCCICSTTTTTYFLSF